MQMKFLGKRGKPLYCNQNENIMKGTVYGNNLIFYKNSLAFSGVFPRPHCWNKRSNSLEEFFYWNFLIHFVLRFLRSRSKGKQYTTSHAIGPTIVKVYNKNDFYVRFATLTDGGQRWVKDEGTFVRWNVNVYKRKTEIEFRKYLYINNAIKFVVCNNSFIFLFDCDCGVHHSHFTCTLTFANGEQPLVKSVQCCLESMFLVPQDISFKSQNVGLNHEDVPSHVNTYASNPIPPADQYNFKN